jgi:hypothetical protein
MTQRIDETQFNTLYKLETTQKRGTLEFRRGPLRSKVVDGVRMMVMVMIE